MREICAILEVMEAVQRRALDAGDISDVESEEVEVEEAAGENVVEECLLSMVVRLGARAKIEVLMFEGNLDAEELLDWIRSMDKYFDYEYVDEDKNVRFVVTRLKGHATLWWDELQAERRIKGK
jgi:Icc-related predicted phosphoesterase